MEIKTKFEIGQVVWIIDSNVTNDKWKVFDKFKIIGINATINRIGKDIDYELKYDNYQVLMLNENICFSTREEAQAECDKRNK